MIERFHTPSSRTPNRIRLSLFDTVAATLAPLAALVIHRAAIEPVALSLELACLYAAISIAAALAAFAALRVGDGLAHFFSLADALLAGKAVFVTAAATALGLFVIDRLDALPRSLMALNMGLLALALLAGRAGACFVQRRRKPALLVGRRNALLVGCDRLADAFISIVEARPESGLNIAALVDPTARLVGRTIRGYRIAGGLESLASLVDEYKVHGVDIDRVLVVVPRAALSPIDAAILSAECARAGLAPEFLDEHLGLEPQPVAAAAAGVTASRVVLSAAGTEAASAIPPGRYFAVKRIIDFIIALALAAGTLPLVLLVAVLVFVDVGAPLLFWQRRVGCRGRRFLVYKFRTFHAPYDRFGNPRLERAELSRIGRWLRRTRLDELPQLYNVLIGEMSIIGPRPLLDVDLPENDERRLAVRPGLTGWAQVNGGKLLSVEDKNLLDCWYIANASPWLDAQILLRTVGMVLFGERDNPEALRKARTQLERETNTQGMFAAGNVSLAA